MAKSSWSIKLLHAFVWILRLSLVVASVLAVWLGQGEGYLFAILALVLSFLPELIERQLKVALPVEFDVVIVLFIYLSIFLGANFDAYRRFFWWDALLHTASGVILAYAGFLVFYIMYKKRSIQTSSFFIALNVFSISLAFGAVWEIFEFTVDQLFGFNMQKSGLIDTMWDLIVDAIGALVMAVIAGRYIARGGVGPIRRLTARFVRENKDLLEVL